MTCPLFQVMGAAKRASSELEQLKEDIIARLKKWQKLCDFRLTEVDYNTVTLKFDTLPDDIEAFVRDAYDLCPDLVQVDEDSDLELLKKNLPKTKKMMLWWD